MAIGVAEELERYFRLRCRAAGFLIRTRLSGSSVTHARAARFARAPRQTHLASLIPTRLLEIVCASAASPSNVNRSSLIGQLDVETRDASSRASPASRLSVRRPFGIVSSRSGFAEAFEGLNFLSRPTVGLRV